MESCAAIEKAGNFQTVRSWKEKFLAKIADAVSSRDVPAEFLAIKASLKQALKDNGAILKTIGAEIENLEAPGVLEPVS